MSYSRLLLVLFVLLVIVGSSCRKRCGYKEPQHVAYTYGETEWLNCDFDHIFIDKSGKTDTLLSERMHTYVPSPSGQSNWCEDDIAYTTSSYSLGFHNPDSTLRFAISGGISDNHIPPKAGFWSMVITSGNQNNSDSLNRPTIDNVLVNGYNYNQVVIITRDTFSHTDGNVWQYYINKEYGLLQYSTLDGNVWKLVR